MTFDITQESWIPVKTLQGEHKTLNLLDFLEQSPMLEGLDGLNSMEEYSMHRFFSVFLLAVFKPEIWEDKLDLLEMKQFDMERIRAYLQMCREENVSFDLFDEKHPFMQSPYNPKYDQEKNLKSPAVLDSTRASGNNPIHFDHNLEDNITLSPVKAFYGLLASQIFSTAMSGGYPSNVYGAPPIFYIPLGKNLYETLILSVPRLSEEKHAAQEFWRNRTEIIPKADVVKTSRLYGMLFPARRICLVENDGIVGRVYYQPGLHFTGFSSWTDPHVAYRRNKQDDMVSIKPSLEKEGWRNIGTISLGFAQEYEGVPEVLEDYANILEEQSLTEMNILTFSVVTNQASYYDMHRGMMKLDVRVTQSKQKCLWVGDAVGFAEDVGNLLRKYLKQMIAPNKNDRGKSDVQRAVHKFFTLCEEQFYQAIPQVSLCMKEPALNDEMQKWKDTVKKKARNIFDKMNSIYCSSSEELVRAEEAYKWFNISIEKI